MDERLVNSSKSALYLNLLFKSLRSDTSQPRLAAFIKRLLQILSNHQTPFICGALHLLGQLFESSTGLRSMIEQPEEADDVEHFVDQPDDDAESVASTERVEEPNKDKSQPQGEDGQYDPRKLEPLYAKALSTCLWDLVSLPSHIERMYTHTDTNKIPLTQHFHPTVAFHATELLAGQTVTTKNDLEQHTLIHFLDRFIYRDVKKPSKGFKGPSAMQPHITDESINQVRLNKGKKGEMNGKVNSKEFWNKNVRDVPVDQVTFFRLLHMESCLYLNFTDFLP